MKKKNILITMNTKEMYKMIFIKKIDKLNLIIFLLKKIYYIYI